MGGRQGSRTSEYSEEMPSCPRLFTNISRCRNTVIQPNTTRSQPKHSQKPIRHFLTSNHISSGSRLFVENKRYLPQRGIYSDLSNSLIAGRFGSSSRCAPRRAYHLDNATLKGIDRPLPYYGTTILSQRTFNYSSNMFLKRGFSTFRGRLDTFRSLSPSSDECPSDPSRHRVFIALGSNIGDRIEMIEKACLEMESCGIRVKRTSSLFETEPMYVTDQEPFINGVCEVSFFSFFFV